MSLLAADGYVALFSTTDGDIFRRPLVCWRDDGTHVYGMLLHRGSLHRAEQVRGFLRYDHEPEPPAPAPAGEETGLVPTFR